MLMDLLINVKAFDDKMRTFFGPRRLIVYILSKQRVFLPICRLSFELSPETFFLQYVTQ